MVMRFDAARLGNFAVFLCIMRKNEYICIIMESYKINYKSDFDFTIKAVDADGVPLDLRKYDWELTMLTANSKSKFIASHKGREWVNCEADGTGARIVCDSHGLDVGKVSMELAVDIPDKMFPDTMRHIVSKMDSGIYLTRGTTEVSHITDAFVFTIAYELNYEQSAKGDSFLVGREYQKRTMPIYPRAGVWYRLYKQADGYQLRLRLPSKYRQELMSNGITKIKIPRWLHESFDMKEIGCSQSNEVQTHLDYNDSTKELFISCGQGEIHRIFILCIDIPRHPIVHGGEIGVLVRVVHNHAEFAAMSHLDHTPFVSEPTKEELIALYHGEQGISNIYVVTKNAGRADDNKTIKPLNGRVHKTRYWSKKYRNKGREFKKCGLVQIFRKTKTGRSKKSVWSYNTHKSYTKGISLVKIT